jgi:hypothetical protein
MYTVESRHPLKEKVAGRAGGRSTKRRRNQPMLPARATRPEPPSAAAIIAAGRHHHLRRQTPWPPTAVTTSAGSEPTPNCLGDNFPPPAGIPLTGSFHKGQQCGDQFRADLACSPWDCYRSVRLANISDRCPVFDLDAHSSRLVQQKELSDSLLIEVSSLYTS